MQVIYDINVSRCFWFEKQVDDRIALNANLIGLFIRCREGMG